MYNLASRFLRQVSLFLVIITFGVLSEVGVSWGGESAWVPLRSNDIFVIPEFLVDMAARMEMIDRAKKTIDIATFELEYSKKVSLPLLSKLREAANRGVKVRVLTTFIGAVARDKLGRVKSYLLYPPTKEPIQFAQFDGSRDGWLIEDSVHEKLLIIDKNIFLTSGRGQAEEHLRWLDTSFAVQGQLVPPTVRFFEDLWRSVTLEVRIDSTESAPFIFGFPKHQWPREFVFSVQENQRWLAYREWVGQLETSDKDPENNQIIGRARVLHFDMIEQFRNRLSRLGSSPIDRIKFYHDPVLRALAWKVRKASSIRLSTLSLILHPVLKSALNEASQNQAKMSFIINGPNATVSLDPVNLPFRSELPELQKLVHLPEFNLFGFEPPRDGSLTYNHRKLAIIDETVFFGSHNFHVQSSTTNDEMSFEIESPAFAAKMSDLFDADRVKYTRILTPDEIDERNSGPDFFRRIFAPLQGLF